jgi:diguanylate cyclase (GGDEF)-like protein
MNHVLAAVNDHQRVSRDVSATRKVSVADVAGRLGPFAITAVVAWAIVLIGTHVNWVEYGVSVALLAVSWSYGVVSALRGRMLTGTVIGSIVFLVALGLARNSVGGSVAAISIISLLPVFQTALYVRDRLALWIVLAGVAAFYLAPLIFIGPPGYPASGYRGALLAVAVSSIVGLVTYQLVGDIRRRASDARHRERILVRVYESVQQLFDSPDPRHDACRAVLEISDALVVALIEPDPLTGQLRVTTSTGVPDAVAAGSTVRAESAVYTAFNSGNRQLICDDVETHLGNPGLWRVAGAPESLLYQPLLRGDNPVGVLAVGWGEHVEATDTHVAVASLLAHEIAAVIDRADVIEQLTDEALTDPLTGLHNRRAWDAQLAQAMKAGREPVAVAMFDIDHFKQFNDTHGHPAGDRLLREIAAAWRSEIRGGDFLARLGGEEFALLLTGKDTGAVHALVERLRARMTANQTCSAGIAERTEWDTPEQLLGRADKALYEAKDSGRDRTVFADSR